VLGACAYLGAVAVACSSTLQGTLRIVTGPDDGFARTPQPTSLLVQFINMDGGATTIANVALPADGGVTLPPEPAADIESIQVTGFDDAGDAVVSGTTLAVELQQVSGATLNIFVQRTGQFSRLPSADGGTATLSPVPTSKPLLTTLYSEMLLVADGTGNATATQVYDTFLWQVLGAGPTLPIAPLSLAYVDTWTGTDAATEAGSIAALLTVGANGTASWLDLTDSTSADAAYSADASAPTNAPFGFGDVAGGQTVLAPLGASYIVGATRLTGAPTKGVLRISPTGVLSWAALTTARLGATAVYVQGQGLYVLGGNAATDGGTGVSGGELLPDGVAQAEALSSVPANTTTGAGAVALDTGSTGHILVAGGVTADGKPSPVRLLSVAYLSGAGGDAGAPWAPLPVTFTQAQVFGLTNTTSPQGYSAVVVGTEASSASLAYILTPQSVTPVGFRVPRSNAQAAILPNGALCVVGGDSGTLESFIR